MNVYFHSDKLARSAGDGAPAQSDAGDNDLEGRIVNALRQVYDPEIPVNIFDLGLIYDIRISDDATVEVDMTLTAPGCPVAHTFPGQVENAVREVDGVSEAHVELVWEPPWSQERISEEAQLALGIL